jgi:hypothetical protein
MTDISLIATRGQNRARGLYDEQHQRLQQEKILLRGRTSRPAFFTAAPDAAQLAGERA